MKPSWFENPQLSAPTPLQVTDDGRVFGHIAQWGTCHTGHRGCLQPPHSRSNYAYFRTGAVQFPGQDPIPTGPITLGTGHAGLNLSAQAAASHYDNTGAAVADVAAGEDSHGIWVAGAIRPGTPKEKVYAFRASSPSGDWRTINGVGLELVAVLSVNSPGFPMPRAIRAAGAPEDCDECILALTAAGTLAREPTGKFRTGTVTSVKAGTIQPGDTIDHPGFPGSKLRVSHVTPNLDGTVRLQGTRLSPDGTVTGQGESTVLGKAKVPAGAVPAGERAEKHMADLGAYPSENNPAWTKSKDTKNANEEDEFIDFTARTEALELAVRKLATVVFEFDESAHPRDEHGRFGSGGEGGTRQAAAREIYAAGERHRSQTSNPGRYVGAKIGQRAHDTAKQLGYNHASRWASEGKHPAEIEQKGQKFADSRWGTSDSAGAHGYMEAIREGMNIANEHYGSTTASAQEFGGTGSGPSGVTPTRSNVQGKQGKQGSAAPPESTGSDKDVEVFVSGAGDDATPTDLVVGRRIHTPKKDKEIKSLLGTTLKKYYHGKTQLLDPSEDPTTGVNMDSDTARITGVPSLSGQGPTYKPRLNTSRAGNTSWQPSKKSDKEAKKKFIPEGQ